MADYYWYTGDANHLAVRGRLITQWELANVYRNRAYTALRRWAAHPGQTPERIVAAIRQVENEVAASPPLTDAIVVETALLQRMIAEDPNPLIEDLSKHSPEETIAFGLLNHLLPWERVRAVRVLDVLCGKTVETVDSVNGSIPYSPFFDHSRDLLHRTPILAGRPLLSPDAHVRRRLRELTRLRATLIVMALCGWRQEHGPRPTPLHVLAEEYFDAVPRDPWSAEAFRYHPVGFPTEVFFSGGVSRRNDLACAFASESVIMFTFRLMLHTVRRIDEAEMSEQNEQSRLRNPRRIEE